MSEATYEAMRAYVRAVVELEVAKQRPEVRAVPTPAQEVNVEEIERRLWERIVPKIPVLPTIVPPKDGKDGENGKDGIATREEMEAAIEKRVAEINVRTFADTYQGVYENGRLYTRGVLTTWGGSLWLSLVDTKRKPGDNNTDWKLVVKK